jgi:murein DD-endopeptidase MepM/ murein hydrolase activator NlpD
MKCKSNLRDIYGTLHYTLVMFKYFILLFAVSFASSSWSQEVAEQTLLRSLPEEVAAEVKLPRDFEGKVTGDFYEAVLKDTQNEDWANTLAEAFKDDFVTAKGLKGQVKYDFKVDSEDQITYARIIVRTAMVEKELQHNEQTELLSLVTKLPLPEEVIFSTPVKAERISSQFNLARRHPVKRRMILPHNGVDFTAKSRTPIYPALEGEVIAMGRTRSKGKFILIEHDNGMKTTYDHLRVFQKGLRVGDYVNLDDQIGEVGRTGYATGTHLHFALINKDGHYLNPIHYLKEYQVVTDENGNTLDVLEEAEASSIETE